MRALLARLVWCFPTCPKRSVCSHSWTVRMALTWSINSSYEYRNCAAKLVFTSMQHPHRRWIAQVRTIRRWGRNFAEGTNGVYGVSLVEKWLASPAGEVLQDSSRHTAATHAQSACTK